MKDWIQKRYKDTLHKYDELRVAVKAAWDAVPSEYLKQLLQARYQAM